jgi:hypothetical protein
MGEYFQKLDWFILIISTIYSNNDQTLRFSGLEKCSILILACCLPFKDDDLGDFVITVRFILDKASLNKKKGSSA